MRIKIITILLLQFFNCSAVIEYIAGNIEYKHISGSCPNAIYDITVNIFSKQDIPGDSIFIYFGDGTHDYIHIVNSLNSYNHITHSVYKTNHTYGCGSFNISYLDTITNIPIQNIGTHNSSLFFLSSTLILNSFYPHNDSYIQFSSPALKISKNKSFNFNVVSSTNNSLPYDSIIHSFASNLNTYNLYLPSDIKINKTSGEIQWLNPDTIGTYVFIINTKMFKDGNNIGSSIHYYKFEVINQNHSYIFDSITNIPTDANNFKQIIYTANNTYSFSIIYNDSGADSIKLVTYPLDFFGTPPTIITVKNTLLKNSLKFFWSPTTADEREYPYNFVMQSISYYPNDSISNSYQTISFKSGLYNRVINADSENTFRLYPNPTNSIINITDEQNELQNSTIIIKNNLGQVIYESLYSNQIDLSNFSSGIYFLSITNTRVRYNTKIIKE